MRRIGYALDEALSSFVLVNKALLNFEWVRR